MKGLRDLVDARYEGWDPIQLANAPVDALQGVGDDRSKVSQDAHHRSGCVSQTISSAAWLSVPYATECVNLTSSERPSKSS